MKKIYMIHGWGGSSRDSVLVWLEEKLKPSGFEIKILEMPNPKSPKVKEWLDYIKNKTDSLDKQAFFIGYSFGCLAILRYLENLNSKIKIGGSLFIAPWIHMDEETIKEEGKGVVKLSEPWMKPPINWEKIKNHTDKFTCIFSDNDPFIPFSETKIYSENLGAKIIIEKNRGHFDQDLTEVGLPSALSAILEMSK